MERAGRTEQMSKRMSKWTLSAHDQWTLFHSSLLFSFSLATNPFHATRYYCHSITTNFNWTNLIYHNHFFFNFNFNTFLFALNFVIFRNVTIKRTHTHSILHIERETTTTTPSATAPHMWAHTHTAEELIQMILNWKRKACFPSLDQNW